MVDPVQDLKKAGDAAEADALGWVERHPLRAIGSAFIAGIVLLGILEIVIKWAF